jgi:hypothetical protein
VDVLAWLNASDGAVIAIATTASVILTVLLLLEARTTRNLRREAAVEPSIRIHPGSVFLIELSITNFGPANARDVQIGFRFTDATGSVIGAPRRQGETLMAPGRVRRFLPSPADKLEGLNELADAEATLHVAWSWADDRRRLWFLPVRQERSIRYLAKDLQADLFGGWALSEHDVDMELANMAASLRKVAGDLGKRRRIEEARERRLSARLRAHASANRDGVDVLAFIRRLFKIE